MPVYLVKFPDGTTQIASAKNKAALMHLIDQVGSPTYTQITSLKGLEWIIEAKPTGSYQDEGFQVVQFSFSVAYCDAGANLEEALREAYPTLSSLGMEGKTFEEALKDDGSANLPRWFKGTVPSSLPLVTSEDIPF